MNVDAASSTGSSGGGRVNGATSGCGTCATPGTDVAAAEEGGAWPSPRFLLGGGAVAASRFAARALVSAASAQIFVTAASRSRSSTSSSPGASARSAAMWREGPRGINDGRVGRDHPPTAHRAPARTQDDAPANRASIKSPSCRMLAYSAVSAGSGAPSHRVGGGRSHERSVSGGVDDLGEDDIVSNAARRGAWRRCAGPQGGDWESGATGTLRGRHIRSASASAWVAHKAQESDSELPKPPNVRATKRHRRAVPRGPRSTLRSRATSTLVGTRVTSAFVTLYTRPR